MKMVIFHSYQILVLALLIAAQVGLFFLISDNCYNA